MLNGMRMLSIVLMTLLLTVFSPKTEPVTRQYSFKIYLLQQVHINLFS